MTQYTGPLDCVQGVSALLFSPLLQMENLKMTDEKEQQGGYLTVPSPDPVSRREFSWLPRKAEQVTKAVWPKQKA